MRGDYLKKAVLVPLALGFILLVVGFVQSYSSLKGTASIMITSSGIIVSNHESNPEETQPQQTSSTTQLDILGFLIILVSIGFFTLAYFNKRKPEDTKHTIH